MALADRLDGNDRFVYVLLGDGESQEGQVWEAAMAAAHCGLDHIVAFVDYNGCQVDGFVDSVCTLEPVEEKWSGFGWDVRRVDGHDVRQVLTAVDASKRTPGAPHMIIADTVKGKGVSFMEGDPNWHSRPIEEHHYRVAVKDLDVIDRGLQGRGEGR